MPTSKGSSIGISSRPIFCSNEDRRIKILDLGLGVLMEADASATFATADGIAVGTVDYMSPEQACGREVDGRSDLYGLGLFDVPPDDRASCRFPASRPSSGWASELAAAIHPSRSIFPRYRPTLFGCWTRCWQTNLMSGTRQRARRPRRCKA